MDHPENIAIDSKFSPTNPSYSLIILWVFTSFVLVALIYIYYVGKKHKTKPKHSRLVVQAVFNDQIDIFHKSKHKNYERKFYSEIVKTALDKDKYAVEILNINSTGKELNVSVSVEYAAQLSQLQMESYFHGKLNTAAVAENIAKFCGSQSSNLITINIFGKYDIKNIRQYQIKQFKNSIDNKTSDFTLHELLPLRDLKADDIKKIVVSWILRDTKYVSFSLEIMRIINEKNIKGSSFREIKDQLDKNTYLNSIIGDFVQTKMLDKICECLKEDG
eukprot:32379_1